MKYPVQHRCHPLWMGPGRPPIATCTRHYGQPAGLTAKAAS